MISGPGTGAFAAFRLASPPHASRATTSASDAMTLRCAGRCRKASATASLDGVAILRGSADARLGHARQVGATTAADLVVKEARPWCSAPKIPRKERTPFGVPLLL